MFQEGGVGWGGVITFMFLCTHRHSNLIIFLAVLQTQALLFHDQLPVGWGGVGCDDDDADYDDDAADDDDDDDEGVIYVYIYIYIYVVVDRF